MGELRLHLLRSGTAPLHIDIRMVDYDRYEKLYDLFSGHHTRIASLCAWYGSQSFFEGRDFPCMQLLDIDNWYPARLGSMPKLQSLQLRDLQWCLLPLSGLPPLKILTLSRIKCTSVLRHSQSLTTLMLYDMPLVDAISGPVTFASLTYLSLYSVEGLKPHINAPCLVTYHEGGSTVRESFNISLPSLVEYGVSHQVTNSADPAKWDLSFPNIIRLSLRASRRMLLALLTSLADQPHSLPALQTINAVEIRTGTCGIPEDVQENIERLNQVRNVVVCFETWQPFQIPLFFGVVGDHLSIRWSCVLLTY